jgi:hypothetical protein
MQTSNRSGVVPKLAAVTAVVIILVAGAIVLVVFTPTKSGSKTSGLQTRSSSPGSTSSAQWTTFNSTISPDGLQGQARLNSTTVLVVRAL